MDEKIINELKEILLQIETRNFCNMNCKSCKLNQNVFDYAKSYSNHGNCNEHFDITICKCLSFINNWLYEPNPLIHSEERTNRIRRILEEVRNR